MVGIEDKWDALQFDLAILARGIDASMAKDGTKPKSTWTSSDPVAPADGLALKYGIVDETGKW